MSKLKKFDPKKFKKEIISTFGSVAKLKKHLKSTATEQWDTKLSEVEIQGVKVKYTNNPNHYAEFFVQIPYVGMTGSYALDFKSYTLAGKRRGAANFKPLL